MTEIDFYLASASPRRKALLADWDYRFEVLKKASDDSDVDETPASGESAEDYVRRITLAKALWGRAVLHKRNLPVLPVLAADTTVALKGRILGKPASPEEAFEFLSALSGRTHDVLTGVALLSADGFARSALSVSRVTFRRLTEEEIRLYIQTGEPMDKAGAYGIQGKAGSFVESITGSFTGIMGLPMTETALLLRDNNIPLFRGSDC
jgi:septum formation protein